MRLKGAFDVPYDKVKIKEAAEEEFRDLYTEFMIKINDRLDRVGTNISDNLGQVLVVDEMPTVGERLHGRIFQLRKAGASDDELYICQQSAGGFEFHQLGACVGGSPATEEWHSGAGAPASGLGNVGDFYLDTTGYDIYEKTGASVWTQKCNIEGATGATGAAGSNGTNGTNGSQGATGPGVVAGGTIRHVLRKLSASDYDTEWVDPQICRYVEFEASLGSPLDAVYTADDEDEVILVDAMACDAYVVLPMAADADGKRVWIKKVDSSLNKVYVVNHESALP